MTDAPNHVAPGTLPFLYCSDDVEKTETAQDPMSLMMGWDGHAVRSCSPMDFQLGHRASAPVPAGEKLKKLQITDQSVLTQCTQLHPNLPDSCFWGLTPPKYSGCLDILYHQLSNPQQISQQCSLLWMVCCMSIPFSEGCMAGHPGVCSASDSFSLNRATWQNLSTLGGGQLLWCHSVALPPFVPPPVRPKDRPPMEGNPRKLLDGQNRKALPFNQGLSCWEYVLFSPLQAQAHLALLHRSGLWPFGHLAEPKFEQSTGSNFLAWGCPGGCLETAFVWQASLKECLSKECVAFTSVCM